MLYESALKQNTIICLGTGTGKTFIAIMVLKELAHQVRPPFEETGKRTVMLVPKVVLVSQQAAVIRQQTDLTVGTYIGAMNVDTWTEDDWYREFCNNQVLVMTPDIFLKHIHLPLNKVNLLIFDEAHWATKNHPYKQIMGLFDQCQDPPKILGLSASLINSKAKVTNIERDIKLLEKNLRSKVIAAGDIKSVNKYGAQPKEEVLYYSPHLILEPAIAEDVEYIKNEIKCLLEFISDCDLSEDEKKSLNNITRNALAALSNALQEMGIWPAKECAIICSRELAELVAMKSFTDPYVALILSAVKTLMNLVEMRLSKHLDGIPVVEQITKFSCPKLALLLETLKSSHPDEMNGKVKNICGIIFAEKRADVKLLAHTLKELVKHDPQHFGFLKVEYVVGQTTRGNCGHNVSSKRQEDILAKFRKHDYNLLVATSVLEEGLDVPRCNSVIRYDFPKTVREYIQSKGRARAEGGKYIIFIPSDDDQRKKDESSLIDFQRIEKIVNSSAREVQESDDEDELVELQERPEDQISPFIPKRVDGAPRCTINNAIAIINKYCMKLPSDSFTKLVPRKVINKLDSGHYVCELTLPINCPIRTQITGRAMSSKKLAKKAAAYDAVIRLHGVKELDDNLNPIGKEALKSLNELGLEPLGDEYNSQGKDEPRPGTTKRRQFYKKRVADILEGSPPEPGAECFLYIFAMKLTCPIPEEQNTRGRKIHDPAQSDRFFGLVIRKRFPPLCDFPVFTRAGEVMISIESCPNPIILSEKQLQSIIDFHHYTFHDVLHVDKYPMKFDPIAAQSNFFMVPVVWNRDSHPDPLIDWQFMDRVIEYKVKAEYEPSEEERKSFLFKREDYEDAVIKPWYRQNKIQFYYYVAEICDQYNPRSEFPDKDYPTFEKYYQEKYKINVMNNEQPLLDVDHTSARLNLLTPRFVNRKGMTLPMSTAKTKKEKRENAQLKQILIPELCVLHPFPASFWRKTVTLPCILYRLNSLLLADQLRQLIMKETRIGSLQFPPGFKWPDLNFGWTLADVLNQEVQVNESIREAVKSMNEPVEIIKETFEAMPVAEENEDSEFVIDVFDPEKYTVNDDSIVDGIDLSNLTIGGVFDIGCVIGQPLGDWDRKPVAPMPPRRSGAAVRELDDHGNVIGDDDDDFADFYGDDVSIGEDQPRVGSPSNFETLKDWDQEEEEDRFVPTGANRGLAKINAPDFNIQQLCEDITKTKSVDDEFEDSDEDMMEDDDDDDFLEENDNRQIQQKKVTKVEQFNTILADGIISSDAPSSRNENYSDFGMVCGDDGKQSPEVKSEGSEVMKLLDLVLPGNKFSDGAKTGADETEDIENDINENETNFGELLPKERRDAAMDIEKPIMRFDAYKNDPKAIYGPSPSMILQALTMSNASDGINLERLETVGDSFLKYAVTAYLYVAVDNLHEGRLSYMRSRIISNFNLYRVGKRKGLGEFVIAAKFEPNDNWLPPGYVIPPGLEQALIDLGSSASAYDLKDLQDLDLSKMTPDKLKEEILKRKNACIMNGANTPIMDTFDDVDQALVYESNCIPYNLLSQQSIPDKSIADCVEALIGAFLVQCGPRGALLFMKWLGLQVMPKEEEEDPSLNSDPNDPIWHHLPKVRGPLIPLIPGEDYELSLKQQREQLVRLYEGAGLNRFERDVLRYQFKDKAYLVQAFTHNSYFENQVTDCYQRLEFLGDAILDFLVTRLLYEDPRKHSPGIITDLRSALVNNTFFASLAVEYEFHKYLKSLSHDLFNVISKFVKSFTWNTKSYRDTFSLYVGEGETELLDDVEVPKALGDIFESVAGAIFLDSGMSLDAVWEVYYRMMKPEIGMLAVTHFYG